MNESTDVSYPVAKLVSAWSFAGLTLNEWAALAALLYSCLLIGDWFWKRVFKPMALVRGWIKPGKVWVPPGTE